MAHSSTQANFTHNNTFYLHNIKLLDIIAHYFVGEEHGSSFRYDMKWAVMFSFNNQCNNYGKRRPTTEDDTIYHPNVAFDDLKFSYCQKLAGQINASHRHN